MKKYVVAITGASGIIIGKRLIEILCKKHNVYAIVSEAAKIVSKYEIGQENIFTKIPKNVTMYNECDIYKNIASGTCKIQGMVIVPCSMKTMSAIATGFSFNLITRSADVCIKEKRKLIISPRESPISEIHLENMLKLAKLGVYIVPPMVQFYSTKNKQQIIDYICGKILDCLELQHTLYKEWNLE